jgi:hypothetical protein
MQPFLNMPCPPGAQTSSWYTQSSTSSVRSTTITIDDDATSTSETFTQDLQNIPPPGYKSAVFDVNWNEIWHRSKRLKGCFFASRHKRVVGTNARVSWVWEHGAKIQHQSKIYWLCRICHLAKKYSGALYSAASTDHCHDHMEEVHRLVDPLRAADRAERSRASTTNPFRLAAENSQLRQAKTSDQQPDNNDIGPLAFDDHEYKRRFIDWVVADNISFRQSVSSQIQWLLLNGGAHVRDTIPNSHRTVSSWIIMAFETSRKQVKDLVATSLSKINLSFDIWTSSNDLALLGVVAHFINAEGCLRVALLGLPRMINSHTGENMATCIKSVINEYDFGQKLGCFMMDNAQNNDTCVAELRRYFPTINEKEQRLRCAGHIFNLVTKAVLYGKGVSKWQRKLLGASDNDTFKLWREKGCIGKVHNFVKYVGRSTARREEFAALQVTAQAARGEKIFAYKLINDGGVRWNSTYSMLKRALKLRDAIDLYYKRYKKSTDIDEYNLLDDELTEEDWVMIRQFVDLLRPFKKMTKHLEGNANKAGCEGSKGAVWEVLESMDFLNSRLESLAIATAHEVNPTYFNVGIQTGWSKLQKYYMLTDESPIYRAAIVLHPGSKEFYFEDKWATKKAWIKEMRIAVKSLYQKYADAVPPTAKEASESSTGDEEEEEVDEFQRFRRISQKFKPRKKARVKDEYDAYNEDFPDPKDRLINNPLAWWNANGWKYPILQKMAYDLFSIPGMSSECERVFSQAKKLITDERNQLGAATIEANQCLKNWITSGLVEVSLPKEDNTGSMLAE